MSFRMTSARMALACSLALGAIATSHAQGVDDSSCIVAGRLSADEARWAPRILEVELLGADGRVVTSPDKQVLSNVRQVRLSAPALLSRCDGAGQLALGPESPGVKEPVPAVGPGVLAVEAVNFPKLRRGGELVELKLSVPAERVTMVTR